MTYISQNISDTHNTMMNVTTQIALAITNLPPFEFSWRDLAPQKPRSCLTVDDLLPSSADGRELFDRACKYVAKFLVEQFDSLKDLQKLFHTILQQVTHINR